jgi:hypothetical protein
MTTYIALFSLTDAGIDPPLSAPTSPPSGRIEAAFSALRPSWWVGLPSPLK